MHRLGDCKMQQSQVAERTTRSRCSTEEEQKGHGPCSRQRAKAICRQKSVAPPVGARRKIDESHSVAAGDVRTGPCDDGLVLRVHGQVPIFL
jgi:hypothetical protein